jgi:hypothetical protein
VVTLIGCWGVGSVGEHADGVAKADDSDGICPSCEGRQTPGRYVNTSCGALVPSILLIYEPQVVRPLVVHGPQTKTFSCCYYKVIRHFQVPLSSSFKPLHLNWLHARMQAW